MNVAGMKRRSYHARWFLEGRVMDHVFNLVEVEMLDALTQLLSHNGSRCRLILPVTAVGPSLASF